MTARSRLVVQAVRLTSAAYSQPAGSLGVIEDTDDDGNFHFVNWIGGSSSGPIRGLDLEDLGEISLSLDGLRAEIAEERATRVGGTEGTPGKPGNFSAGVLGSDIEQAIATALVNGVIFWTTKRGIRRRGGPKWAQWGFARLAVIASGPMTHLTMQRLRKARQFRMRQGGWDGTPEEPEF
jgi:hypothetical protein